MKAYKTAKHLSKKVCKKSMQVQYYSWQESNTTKILLKYKNTNKKKD